MTNGWQTVPLAEVLKQDTNYVTELEPIIYPKLSVKLYGKGAVLDAPTDGANIKMQRHQFAKSGQIILSEIWAKKGAIGIVPKEGEGALVTSHFFLFDVIETKVLREFVGLLLKRNYFAEALDAHARGTTGYAAVRPKQFLSLEIPLPPLDEQHRIVKRVEALATIIVRAQSLREQANKELEHFEASLFNKVLGEISKELPQGWEWKSASEFCVAVDCGSTPEAGLLSSGSGEVPFIKVYNLTFDGTLDFSIKPTFVSAETHNNRLKRSKVYPGDVLTNIVGPPLGKVSIVPDTYPEWNINQAIVSFRVNKEVADNKYLAYILQSPDFQARTRATTKGTAGQDNIRLSTCRDIPMPIPPLDEQRRIVAYLDGLQAKVNAVRELQSASGEELSALMPSILDKAFKGEL